MPIRLGFYGAGFIARMHTLSLAACPIAHTVTAVHDPDAERAKEFAARYGAAVVGEAELLDHVDAVYVTTWTSEHARLVEEAAARGKAVFCEKPLAVERRRPRSAWPRRVERAGVPNQVGLVLRFLSPFRFAEAPARRPARRPRARGGVPRRPVHPDPGPVRLGLARAIRRAPGAARCSSTRSTTSTSSSGCSARCARSAPWSREVHGLTRIDDVAVARLDFESGAVASLTSVWHDILERPSNRRIEIFCERLFVAIEGDLVGPVRFQFTGEAEQVLEGPALREALRAKGDDVANPATAFLTAVRDGKPADPDFAAALPAQRLADAVYASADAGGALVTGPYR